jgi:hypothetical protein
MSGMDRSFGEQKGPTNSQWVPKSFLVSPPIFESLIKWLASLVKWTEEEQEEARIYLGRLGGE